MDPLRHEIDDAGDVVIVVLDYRYRPAVPGKCTGHPATWAPDEPEEFEVLAWRLEVDGQDCGVDHLAGPQRFVKFFRPELTALARKADNEPF